MGIKFNKEKKMFKLDTSHTTYMIGISEEGYVGHVYYGKKLSCFGGRYLLRTLEAPFTPSVNPKEKASFLDFYPMEYPAGGVGDYRESCLDVRNVSGSIGSEFFYSGHEIIEGKPGLSGLPSSFGEKEDVQTLLLECKDLLPGVRVTLIYSAFEREDVITRSVKVENIGSEQVRLEKVYSACLDMENRDYEMLSLCGAWARERHIQRKSLSYGRQLVSSSRGVSSHQEHPFIALVTPETTQETGEVYAMHFVYSGNFAAQAERTQFDYVRMVMGIHAGDFCWRLEPGEAFQAPEVVMTYSDCGLGKMSRSLHDFYREHMIRSPFKYKKRPILINNWEATYFDFDDEKLLEIAKAASEKGIEMLVMDDGWFGKRNREDRSLGDWTVNEDKLKGGLNNLVERVRKMGMEFGIWFEPEMVSGDSKLYLNHPDWAVQISGRTPVMGRAQYVLDLSRKVRDYVYESIAAILRSASISYVKRRKRELSGGGHLRRISYDNPGKGGPRPYRD